MNWNKYYMEQVGGSINVYKGAPYQRGYGLGGVFKRFFNWIVPIVQKHALPALESGAKIVGREAVASAADIAKDVISGREFKNAAEVRLNSAIDNLKSSAEKKLEGRGIKSKHKAKKFLIVKKKSKKLRRFPDIFDK